MRNKNMVAWAHLIATTVIWGTYFVRLGQSMLSGDLLQVGFAEAMGLTLGIAIGLSILTGLLIEFLVNLIRSEPPSRREADAEAWAGLRATRVAHGVVVTLIMTLSGLALVLGAFAGPTAAAQVEAWLADRFGYGLILFANAGLFVLVLAEMVHYGALLVFLGRGRR